MVKRLFLLSGDNSNLAKAELDSLVKKVVFDNHRIGICEIDKKKSELLSKRLSFTHSIYKLIFVCSLKDIIEKIKCTDFNKYYSQSYKVELKFLGSKNNDVSKKVTEKYLAEKIWHRLKKPIVNLKNSKTTFYFFIYDKRVYCCLKEHDCDKSYNLRKPHLRPVNMPVSLNPKLARCLVNLTGAKKKDTIIDPFCGTGGILLEAGLLGIKTIGYDIDKRMIKMSQQNLEHYKVKNFKLYCKDALELTKRKVKFIVTDLPYGKNTKTFDYENLFIEFFKNLKICKGGKVVSVFLDSMNYKKILKKSGLKINKEFDYYIHKSMTKKIIVI